MSEHKHYVALAQDAVDNYNKFFGTEIQLVESNIKGFYLLEDIEGHSIQPHGITKVMNIRSVYESMRWMFKSWELMLLSKNATLFEREIGAYEFDSNTKYSIGSKVEYAVGKYNEINVHFYDDNGNYLGTFTNEYSQELPIQAIIRFARQKFNERKRE